MAGTPGLQKTTRPKNHFGILLISQRRHDAIAELDNVGSDYAQDFGFIGEVKTLAAP